MATILSLLEEDRFEVHHPIDDIRDEENEMQRELHHLSPTGRIELLLGFSSKYLQRQDLFNYRRIIFQVHEIYTEASRRQELPNGLFFFEYQLCEAFYCLDIFDLFSEYLFKADQSAKMLFDVNDKSRALSFLTDVYLKIKDLESARQTALLSPIPTQFIEVINAFGPLFQVARVYIGADLRIAEELLNEIRLRASNLAPPIQKEIVAAVLELENTIIVQQLGDMAIKV